MSHHYTRRTWLGATVAVVTGLAGCSDSRSEDADHPTGTEHDGHQEEQDEEVADPFHEVTGYELKVSPVDLTELNILEADGYTQQDIQEQFYSEVSLVATLEDEEGQEIEEELTDLVEFHLENQDGERITTQENQLPEYAVRDGDTLTAIIDRAQIIEALEQHGYDNAETENTEAPTGTVEKQLPSEYRRDIRVDGSKEQWLNWQEKIIGKQPEPYTTEFQYDTQDFTIEEFFEQRNERTNNLGDPEEIKKAGEELDLNGLDKQEKIRQVSDYVNSNLIRDSAQAVGGATMMERILREHGDVDEPIVAGGFHNPADPNEEKGMHGSQMIHVDGDNYHSETTVPIPREGAIHVDKIDTIAMKTGGGISDFVSVVAEFTPGFPELNGNYAHGMGRLRGLISAMTDNHAYAHAVTHDHDAAFAIRDAIVDNEFEEALLGSMAGAMRHAKTNEYTGFATLDDEVVAISSDSRSFMMSIARSQSMDGEGIIERVER